ncbi:triphosphoribosyl-dephospho-CoA synthase [Rhodoblastus acidophilus]|uniref:triphosphoribosyl-dephospho-CoA synthase MdcB n=1 Tax=Rhodoblastus acidophilus TaxID=1074 RepID=UPI0022255C8C|nr:triphosphoribosyl-dephospho-CoA synthase MdcB [Rhodoblastus acidophilus]MCW2286661.1 triphosphoribosyl-dephospho-CoA synthase [Rhodoblastus acidophilus]MCW2335481.1 triphosphoribosyl-dephospho-CoA synthase [Rhodoblastus acidophilus]
MSALKRSLRLDAAAIGARALDALRAELQLHPKPGLVSFVDSGAHDDMDAQTFVRSIAALDEYFPAIAEAGATTKPFAVLQRLGLDAEQKMLAATGGVNTHRGAIFCLGLLVAAAGHAFARGLPCDGDALTRIALELWGADIAAAAARAGESHGARAVRAYGVRGAREEFLAGLPVLNQVALPALKQAFRLTGCSERARAHALFAIMSELQDTNLLHRGGWEGLVYVQRAARAFLAQGSVLHPGWRACALKLHGDCVALNLSPGGAADTLAAAIFLVSLS